MVLVYHKIDHKPEWGINVVSPVRLEQQLDFLQRLGYSFYGITAYLTRRSIGDQKALSVMFDDAYENVYQFALPILQSKGIEATLGVISSFVGLENQWDFTMGKRFRHATWEQLLEMTAHGWEIASHSCSHNYLSSMSINSQLREMAHSRSTLETRLGVSVKHLIYPFGRANKKTAGLALMAGYQSASILGQILSPKTPYFLPRRPVYCFDTPSGLLRKLRNSPFETAKEKTMAFGSKLSILYQQLSGNPHVRHC